MSTRDVIIFESLKLFSVNGFAAVSTRMIARAANLSDSGLYKHFKSKREIFDTIISICKQRFIDQQKKIDIHKMCWNDVSSLCLQMYQFQTKDEWIVMFRRILVIEQFKNAEMAAIYKSFFIDTVLNGLTYMFTELIEEGYMRPGNPRVYAMEIYAPFFMYHTLSPDSKLLEEQLKEHAEYFTKNYGIHRCDVKDRREK